MQPVGIIGLGLLGSALAERLRARGYTCLGFDINAQRLVAFEQTGAAVARDIREIAGRCSMIVLSLPDSPAVRSVADQLLSAARGQFVVDTTTGDPEDTASIAAHLAAHDITYFDATVVGSSQMARGGEITLIVGGAIEPVEHVRKLLDDLGKQWFYVGPPGSGARAKLIVNLVLGLHRAVLAEALALARKSGLDPHRMLEILRSGAAYSRVMDTKGRKMIEHDFSTEARLRQHHKDVRLILEQGKRHDAHLPLSQLHDQLLSAVEALGWADADNSAIVMAFENEE